MKLDRRKSPLLAATLAVSFAGCATAPHASRTPASSPSGPTRRPTSFDESPQKALDCAKATGSAAHTCALIQKQAPETLGILIGTVDAFLLDQALHSELAKLKTNPVKGVELTSIGKGLGMSNLASALALTWPAVMIERKSSAFAAGSGSILFTMTGLAVLTGSAVGSLGTGKNSPYRETVVVSPLEIVRREVEALVPAIADLFLLAPAARTSLMKKLEESILDQHRQGKRGDFRFDVVKFMESEGFVEKSRIDAFERVAREIENAKIPEIDPNNQAQLVKTYAGQLPTLKRIQTQLGELVKRAGDAKTEAIARLRMLNDRVGSAIARIEFNSKLLKKTAGSIAD